MADIAEKATIEHVLDTHPAMLRAYDAHVLGGYETATELSHLLNRRDIVEETWHAVVSALNLGTVPEGAGTMLASMEGDPERISARKYAMRRLYLEILDVNRTYRLYAAKAEQQREADDLLIKMYRIMTEMSIIAFDRAQVDEIRKKTA